MNHDVDMGHSWMRSMHRRRRCQTFGTTESPMRRRLIFRWDGDRCWPCTCDSDTLMRWQARRGGGRGVGDDSLGTDDILHPRKRLYLGGASSVRGFGENQLGPHVLTVAPELLRGSGDSSTVCSCCNTTGSSAIRSMSVKRVSAHAQSVGTN